MIRFSFVLSLLFWVGTAATAQFALDGGLTFPVGDFADEEEGSAGLGFRLALNYDYAFAESVGLTSKLFAGFNTFDPNDPSVDADNWSVAGLGAGIYYQPQDALKLYGMLLVGSASTPKLNVGNVLTLSEASGSALGIELGAKYFLSNFYLTAAFTTFTPEFTFDIFGTIIQDELPIGFLSIGAGYQFGGK